MRATAGWVLAGVVVGCLACAAWGESGGGSAKKPSTTPKPPTVYWIVVEVKDLKGTVKYEAIQFKELKNRVERSHQEYVRAVENWNKEKKDSLKNKEKFDTPKPVEGYVKRVGDSTTYKSQEDAKAAVQKILDAIEAKKKAAEEKAADEKATRKGGSTGSH